MPSEPSSTQVSNPKAQATFSKRILPGIACGWLLR